MRHDLLSDALHVIKNAEQVGKRACFVPASSLVKDVLMVVQRAGYVGDFEFVDDGKSGSFKVSLVGTINKIQSIRPRFSVGKGDFKKWETRFLPAQGFGVLILTTSKGVMSQKEATEQGVGGKLLGYVY